MNWEAFAPVLLIGIGGVVGLLGLLIMVIGADRKTEARGAMVLLGALIMLVAVVLFAFGAVTLG